LTLRSPPEAFIKEAGINFFRTLARREIATHSTPV